MNLRRKLFCAALVISTLGSPSWLVIADQGQSIPPAVRKIWFEPNESRVEEAAFFIPRLVYRPVRALIAGETMQRARKTALFFVYSAKAIVTGEDKSLKDCGYRYSDGLLNVGGAINSLVSDVAAVVKSPFFSTARLSHRVMVCTTNLSNAMYDHPSSGQIYDPADHVAVLIDGGLFETADPESKGENDLSHARDFGAVTCRAAPLLSRSSESLAIEKLQCLDAHYSFDYSFFRNNCGAYTADILKMAGFRMPDLPNLGVGILNRNERQERIEKMNRARSFCDQETGDFLRTIRTLESGRPIKNVANLQKIVENSAYSNDARLQWATTAARSKDPKVRAAIVKGLYANPPQYPISEVHFPENITRYPFELSLDEHLRAFYAGLTQKQIQWMNSAFPWNANFEKQVGL